MISKSVSIRPYDSAADQEFLSDIWLDASRGAHAFIGERRLQDQKVLVQNEYLPKAEAWVAVINKKPVGFISLLNCFVGGLFVAVEHQGHGIGKALVAHAISLKSELQLEVYTANVQAVAFYKALGFVEVSRRPLDDDGYPFESARFLLIA